jgi:hypothetical protein
MAITGLKGPFSLTGTGIDREITKISAGAYALGHINGNDVFIVSYVGRSDNDLNGRLKQWINEKNYKQFKYDYFPSPKSAFEKECHLYHDFGGKEKLDNEIHPDRPEDTNWECPVCFIFD